MEIMKLNNEVNRLKKLKKVATFFKDRMSNHKINQEGVPSGKEDMMKKRILMIVAAMAVCAGLATGCSGSPKQENANEETGQPETAENQTGTEEEQPETAEGQTGAAEEQTGTADDKETASGEEDGQASTVSGVVEEIKDFMFVINDENGTGYAFSFEEKPEGLDNIKVGDTVTVTYTGTISEVDPFEGEILSIEK